MGLRRLDKKTIERIVDLEGELSACCHCERHWEALLDKSTLVRKLYSSTSKPIRSDLSRAAFRNVLRINNVNNRNSCRKEWDTPSTLKKAISVYPFFPKLLK